MKQLKDYIYENTSLITHLKNTHLPIVLYGMGDGAVKLLSILNKNGIKCEGIFASDEFARYNEFCSYTVKKLSDIEKEFDEFIILVSFATRIDSVREKIFAMSEKHELYVPDINVSGDALEIFDEHFFEKHYSRLNAVFNALDTNRAKMMFSALINFKFSGKIEYLEKLENLRMSDDFEIESDKVKSFADFGAYTGDTLKEALELYPNITRAVAFEPDLKNFKKLSLFCETFPVKTDLFPYAVHNTDTDVNMVQGAGRNTTMMDSAFATTRLSSKKAQTISARRADSVMDFVPDLIKMDVEGNEINALEGCRKFFDTSSPILKISIYHNNRDLFEVFEKIQELKKGYKFTISQKCAYIPAWDVELVAY